MSKARDLANAGTALTTVSATELGYLDGVTSAVQTQINAQIPKSTVTAKGDLLVATGSGTVVRQGVGTDGQFLSANSAQADGVEWVTLATGGANFTLLNSGGTATTSGSSVTVSGISGMNTLYIRYKGISANVDYGNFYLRLNGDTGNNYIYDGFTSQMAVNTQTENSSNGTSSWWMGRTGDTATNVINGGLMLYGCNSSGIKVLSQPGGGGGNYNGLQVIQTGFYSGTSTISSVTIFTGNTFDAGTIFVYGSAN
jgi:hypothetical protein